MAEIERGERDRQWVARLRAGDERALAEIFAAYYSPLSRYAETIVRSRDAAFDIASDVFHTLWVKRAELDPADLRAYLITAARNRALNAERHRRVEETAVAELSSVGWAPGADEAFLAGEERRDRAAAIDRAFAALPPGTRTVLDQWVRGKSYQEIGQALGIAVNTVNAHLQKAKRILRQTFGGVR
jgi:RNA polymerase sigma factor (sigma-70 family)